jgi:hypothetical protein
MTPGSDGALTEAYALINSLRKEIEALRRREGTAMAAGPEARDETSKSEDTTPRVGSSRPRHTLPHCTKFTGERKSFPSWLIEIDNKLNTDGSAIGTPRDQFNYIFSSLEQKPKDTVLAFVRLGGSGGRYDPNEFITYLETNYADPNRLKRSLDKLRELKQTDSESFSAFLPKFERELADSGGTLWPDEIKINYLEGAINRTMLEALVAIEMPTEYISYVTQCQKTGSKIDGLKYRGSSNRPTKSSNNTSRRTDSSTGRTNQNHTLERVVTQATVDGNSMDWEPTDVVKVFKISDPKLATQISSDNQRLKGKRAKWVTSAELQARRREGRCIRCGRTYCNKDVCPLKPAIKPDDTNGSTKVNSTKPIVTAAVVEELSDSDEDYHSGNE